MRLAMTEREWTSTTVEKEEQVEHTDVIGPVETLSLWMTSLSQSLGRLRRH